VRPLPPLPYCGGSHSHGVWFATDLCNRNEMERCGWPARGNVQIGVALVRKPNLQQEVQSPDEQWQST
jgi:hypothetical protein